MGALLAGGLTGLLNQSSAQVIDGSLKFDKTSSTYLTRTPASAGNRKVWTLSYWIKLSGDAGHFLSANNDAFQFEYRSTGQLLFANSGSTSGNTLSTALFRDHSAFYHVVIQHDAVNLAANVYINGTLNFTATLSNADGTWNNNTSHNINGRSTSNDSYGSFAMSQVNFIDGQALGPGYFGFTDPLTNTWRPKKFRAEGTTANDGRTWSDSSNLTNITNGADAFDGNLTGDYAHATGAGNSGTINFSNLTSVSTLRLYAREDSREASGKITVNTTDFDFPTTAAWVDVSSALSGGLSSITLKNGSYITALFAIEVDGVVLRNGITTNLAFGTNGFYLPMDGNSSIGEDKSGKGNNWTAVNFSGTSIDPDVLKDSPSGAVSGGRAQTGITTTSSAPSNYATLNPLNMHQSSDSLLDGNLQFSTTGSGGGLTESTLAMSSGKFYFESVFSGSQGGGQFAGIRKPGDRNYNNSYIYVGTSNKYTNGGSGTSYGAGLSNGDIIGTAFDATNGTLTFYKNGLSQGIAFTGISGTYSFFVGSFGGPPAYKVNFGQKPFKYAPPQGFLPLNSASATPETVITRPDQYVNVAAYTAAGADQIITLGFKPDLIISKSRDNNYAWDWEDILRGGGFKLRSNTNDSQTDYSSNAPIREWRRDGVRCSTNMNATYGSGDSVSYGFVAGNTAIPECGAISFDGTGDYLTFASTSAFHEDAGYTIDGWIYLLTAPANSNGEVIFDTGSGGSDPELNVYADGSGNIQLYESLSNNTNWNGGASYMKVGQWHYFKQTVDGSSASDASATHKLYIDGQLGVQNTINLSSRTASSAASIAARTNGSVIGHFILSNLRYRDAVDNSTDVPTAPFTGSEANTVLLCCNKGAPASGNADPTDSTITPSTITKQGNPGNANITIFGRFTKDGVAYTSAAAAGLDGGNITPTGASVGTKQGFSIIKYTGTGNSSSTLSHGLIDAPQFMIIKNLIDTENWFVWHHSYPIPDRNGFYLDLTANIQNFGSTSFSTTLPSSSVITLSTNNILNGSGDQFVAYVWHDVPGVQKFGSYVGNGNADGPFVEIGFRPAILWIKNLTTNGELWAAHDSKRDPINPAKERFELNESNGEDNSQDARIKDFLSNGFKIRGTSGEQNTDGDTYIYMAWAEAPTFNLYGGQSNAR